MFKRLIASLVCVAFIFSNLQYVHAQGFSVNQLPVPGTMVGVSSPFSPLALKGLIVNPQKPLEFQFIVDTGRGAQDTASVKEQANQLVKYFLAGLTIPEGDLWVNLSPYEKDRMVPEVLGQTDLGRDLLAQDYILKQLTASLIYPEKSLGKEFWSRVYAKAQQQFGTTNIPVNTFNKVWILPNQAQVFENGNAAYVTKSTLKVMLDEDYLAKVKHTPVRNDTGSIGANIVRQIILPEIEKEVNTGKNFAPLRQIYQALILAKWYKETIQNGLLDAVYTNKNKVAGVNLNDPAIKEQIYQRYLKAYKKGAFNYIKEDPTPDGQVVPRKYFSGGLIWKMDLDRTHDPAMLTKILAETGGVLLLVAVGLGAAVMAPAPLNFLAAVTVIAYLVMGAEHYGSKMVNRVISTTKAAGAKDQAMLQPQQTQDLFSRYVDMLSSQDIETRKAAAAVIIADPGFAQKYEHTDVLKRLLERQEELEHKIFLEVRDRSDKGEKNAIPVFPQGNILRFLQIAINLKKAGRDFSVNYLPEKSHYEFTGQLNHQGREISDKVITGKEVLMITPGPLLPQQANDAAMLSPVQAKLVKNALNALQARDQVLPSEKIDDILILGNNELEVFRHALRLWREHQESRIVISGGVGRLTDLLISNAKGFQIQDSSSEAVIIHQIMEQMITNEAEFKDIKGLEKKPEFVLETGSKTTPQNVQFYKNMIEGELQKRDWNDPYRIVYLQTPHQQLRAKATVEKYLADELRDKRIVALGNTSEYATEGKSGQKIMEDILGEAVRLIVYSKYGNDSIADVNVPADFWQTATALYGSISEAGKDQLDPSLFSLAAGAGKPVEEIIKEVPAEERNFLEPIVARHSNPAMLGQPLLVSSEAVDGAKAMDRAMLGGLQSWIDYNPQLTFIYAAGASLAVIWGIWYEVWRLSTSGQISENITILFNPDVKHEEAISFLKSQGEEATIALLQRARFNNLEALREYGFEIKEMKRPMTFYDYSLRDGKSSNKVIKEISYSEVSDPSTGMNRNIRLDNLLTTPDYERIYVGDSFWTRVFRSQDNAMLNQIPSAKENGGIDLDQINVNRTGNIINVKFDQAQLDELRQGGFKGFTPVIIKITPVTDLLQYFTSPSVR